MSATEEFRALADEVVDGLLAADPVEATWLGDHRFDDRLPDPDRPVLRDLDEWLTRLDAIDDVDLGVDDLVDLEILRARVLREQFDAVHLRRPSWDPMWWNPGSALYLLVSRGDVGQSRDALAARLGAVPDLLATARTRLGEMPRIHAETAAGQLAGTVGLIEGPVAAAVAAPALVADAARATADFAAWLGERAPESHRDPRLGPDLYPSALWHALDDDVRAEDLRDEAYADLAAVGERMRGLAAEYLGLPEASDEDVRRALAGIAAEHPVDDATVLPLMAAAMDSTERFVRERDLVGVPDLDARVIEMPEIHRGVAVAYCDAPGPLEPADLPTFVAVAPTPAGWSDERVASFYREYNGAQLHDLAAHEAVPGHVLQLAHARTLSVPTRVRRFGRSGVFVEGWAVYAEDLLVRHGYGTDGTDRGRLAFALQQGKMLARGIINAILDIEVHAHGMPEVDAMDLMIRRGFQEEGEAAGKWRRALLTVTQLPTYYAGYRAVRGIAADLEVLHPDWSPRQVHDLMLGHGSPAPRHLRMLIGL
jgi:hypothetical protein